LPVECGRWKRFRKSLLDADITIFDVYLLEQAYIRAFLKKKPDIFSTALHSVINGTREDSKELVGRLAPSIINFIDLASNLMSLVKDNPS